MSRTKRKPYTGSKAVDTSCRSHGNCPACARARKAKDAKRAPMEQLNSAKGAKRG